MSQNNNNGPRRGGQGARGRPGNGARQQQRGGRGSVCATPARSNPGRAKTARTVDRLSKKTVTHTRQQAARGPPKDGLKGVVEQITDTVSPVATHSADVNEEWNPTGYAYFLTHWLEQLLRSNPLLVLQTAGADNISPKDLWNYGMICAFACIKETGTMSGNGVGNLPKFSTMHIPASLAKILQYFQPYSRGGVKRRMKFTQDLTANTGSTSVGPGIADFFPADYPVTLSPTVIVAGKPYQSASAGANPNLTYIDFIQTRLSVVGDKLAKSAGTVAMVGADLYMAPSSAGYAGRTNPGQIVSIDRYLTSESEWQLAQVFGTGRPMKTAQVLEHPAYGPQDLRLFVNYTPSAEHQIAAATMFILNHADTIPKGDSTKFLRYRDQRIKDLLPSYKYIEGDAFLSVTSAMYAQMVNMNENFDDNSISAPDSDGPFAKFVTAMILAHILFHRRCSEHSPFPIAARDGIQNNIFRPQAFANPGLPGSLVPPVLEEFISSHGVSVLDGHMVVPNLATDLVNLNPARLELLGMSAYNPAAYKGGGSEKLFPYRCESYTTTPPEMLIGQVKYDAAEAAQFEATYVAQGFASLFPIPEYGAISRRWSDCLSAIGSVAGNMVVHSEESVPYGAACQMMTYTGDRIPVSIVVNPGNPVSFNKRVDAARKKIEKKGFTMPEAPIPSSMEINFDSAPSLQSAIPLDADEVVKAIAFGSERRLQLNAFDTPHGINIAVPAVIKEFVDSSLSIAMSPNFSGDSFDSADLQPQVVNGLTVDVNPIKGADKPTKSYNGLVCKAAHALYSHRPVVCSAVDYGAGFIPVIGNFLRGNVKAACESGLGALVNYLDCRCIVTSSESTAAKNVEGSSYIRTDNLMEDLMAIAKVAKLNVGQKDQLLGMTKVLINAAKNLFA